MGTVILSSAKCDHNSIKTEVSPSLEWALHYAARGWMVFPLDGETKISHTWRGEHGPERWGATKDPATISERFAPYPNAGIGIPTGCENGFWVIETDTKNDKDGESELAKLQAQHGPLPATYRVRSPSGSIHYYYQHPGPDAFITCSANKIAPGVDVKGDAGMVVCPPTARGGKRYEIIDNVPIAVAPQWLLDLVTRKMTDEEKRIVRHAPPTDEPTVGQWEIAKLERWVREALEKNPDWFDVRENALKTVWGIKRAGYGRAGYKIAQIICERVPETQRVARVDRFWNDRDANNGTASLDTFWKMCAMTGIKPTPGETTEWHAQKKEHMFDGVAVLVDAPPLVPGQLPPCPVPPPSTGSVMPRGGTLMGPRGEILPMDADDSLALDFTDKHVSELRHCEEWGKWLRWDGTRWTQDKTSGAYNLVRQHLRRLGGGMHLQDARKILSAKTVAAVERMAKTDPRIATEAAIWDADPWLLNTPGRVVDLRTCVIREVQPSDHMTKITAVTPGGDCPTWKAFLHKSLAGDVELIAFVQRMLGYSLTGDTREQALFFLYGQGGNGKGVLLNTVAGILADYAKTAPMATFTDSANASDRHPTDLAGLRGARFVMASETEKGRKWAEAKIKSLTGGDPIAARFMGRDFFEYVPQFKLVIAGNHKPRLGTVDEAIRRRMNMIPFTIQIPAAERDAALPDRLKAEWGGILQWMVEGCMAWQQGGLKPPAAVRTATDEYLSSQDALATWLDERCEQAIGAWASKTDLFSSWSGWANNARERSGNASEFYEALTSKGFEEAKRQGVRGFRGVRVRSFNFTPPPPPC
jgi:putative DNA primase/helicase